MRPTNLSFNTHYPDGNDHVLFEATPPLFFGHGYVFEIHRCCRSWHAILFNPHHILSCFYKLLYGGLSTLPMLSPCFTHPFGCETYTLPLASGMFNVCPQSMELMAYPKVTIVYLRHNVVVTGSFPKDLSRSLRLSIKLEKIKFTTLRVVDLLGDTYIVVSSVRFEGWLAND